MASLDEDNKGIIVNLSIELCVAPTREYYLEITSHVNGEDIVARFGLGADALVGLSKKRGIAIDWLDVTLNEKGQKELAELKAKAAEVKAKDDAT